MIISVNVYCVSMTNVSKQIQSVHPKNLFEAVYRFHEVLYFKTTCSWCLVTIAYHHCKRKFVSGNLLKLLLPLLGQAFFVPYLHGSMSARETFLTLDETLAVLIESDYEDELDTIVSLPPDPGQVTDDEEEREWD